MKTLIFATFMFICATGVVVVNQFIHRQHHEIEGVALHANDLERIICIEPRGEETSVWIPNYAKIMDK